MPFGISRRLFLTGLVGATGGVLLWPLRRPVLGEAVSPGSLSSSALLDRLTQAQIIYLGEVHDRPADHRGQLAMLQALTGRRSLAIGLEMFQRPFQRWLDRYLAGEIGETALRTGTEYPEHWGWPWRFYAPVLRWAKQHQIPLIALNTPTEVTRRVGNGGIAALTSADFQWIPPQNTWQLDDPAYQDRLRDSFAHHGDHGGEDRVFGNFWAAQVIWDETMAAAIADYHRQHPQTLLLVLAGQGHLSYGQGIPQRVKNRLGNGIDAPIVFFDPGDREAADYIWTPSPLRQP